MSNVEVYENDAVIGGGMTMNLAINFCDVAARVLNLNNETCMLNRTFAYEYLENVYVETKYLTRYIDVNEINSETVNKGWAATNTAY